MNISTNLFDLLVSKNFTIKTLDSKGKPVIDPSEAEMFSFDFEVGQNNYGTVVILLGDEKNFEIYYGDNVGKRMEPGDKDVWYDFLNHLRNFARRGLCNFTIRNINQLKYSMQGMAAIKEGLFEGWNGTKHTSYNNKRGTTRLKIVHNKAIGEGEQRWRAVEQLFVETADGERFKLPFKSLQGGRAMARHIQEGGNPYDVFGEHIVEMVREINALGPFVRATRSITEDDGNYNLVETGRNRYQTLRKRLKQVQGKRGYHSYTKEWSPHDTPDSDEVVNEIRGQFTRETVDDRIENALPYLSKLTYEGDVVSNKFAMKQAQKGKDKYKYNNEIANDIPMYDPINQRNIPAGIDYPDGHVADAEPYDHFEVKEVSKNSAHIMGITTDGYQVQTSTTAPFVAHALVDAYNRGGFTDKKIEKVPLGDSKDDNMKELNEFENWATNVTEGTWSIPDSKQKINKLKQIMSRPLEVGTDGTNATEQLYDIIGDDSLFDSIEEMAAEDPSADARILIKSWFDEEMTEFDEYNPKYQMILKNISKAIGGMSESVVEGEGIEDFRITGANDLSTFLDMVKDQALEFKNSGKEKGAKELVNVAKLIVQAMQDQQFSTIDSAVRTAKEIVKKYSVTEQVDEIKDLDTNEPVKPQKRDPMLELKQLSGVVKEETLTEKVKVEEPVEGWKASIERDYPEVQFKKTMYNTIDAFVLGGAYKTEIPVGEYIVDKNYGWKYDKPNVRKTNEADINSLLTSLTEDDNIEDIMYKIAELKKLASQGGMGKEVQQEILRTLKHLQMKVKAKKQKAKPSRNADNWNDIPTHTLAMDDINEMSDDEEADRERMVKGMKKNKADLKKRYGKDWENVMYATATKKATEAIVPTPAGKYKDDNGEEYKYYDDETGELFFDKPEPTDGGHKKLSYRDFTKGASKPKDEVTMFIQSNFGDIAAGGGDPISYIMDYLEAEGMVMSHADALERIEQEAQAQGFNDAYEWADSYRQGDLGEQSSQGQLGRLFNEIDQKKSKVAEGSKAYTIEYRDPEHRFNVLYDYHKEGYVAKGLGEYENEIQYDVYDQIDDAIQHAEMECSAYSDEYKVEEGIRDKVKKFARNPGREFTKGTLWGNTTPKEMWKKVQSYSDDELKSLLGFHDHMGTDQSHSGSERAAQVKMIKRELRRRGYRDFEKYMDEGIVDRDKLTDPYEQGFYAKRADSNPYQHGTEEAARWDKGNDDAWREWQADMRNDAAYEGLEEGMGDPAGEINLPKFLEDFLGSVLGVYWTANGQGGPRMGSSTQFVYTSHPSAGIGNTEAALQKNKYVTVVAREGDGLVGDISGPNMEDYRFTVRYSGSRGDIHQTWNFYDQNKNESVEEDVDSDIDNIRSLAGIK